MVAVAASKTTAVKGTFQIDAALASSSYSATDTPKLYAMGNAEGYDAAKIAEGKVKMVVSITTQ